MQEDRAISWWKKYLVLGIGLGIGAAGTWNLLASASQRRPRRSVASQPARIWAKDASIPALGNTTFSFATQIIDGTVHYKFAISYPGTLGALSKLASAATQPDGLGTSFEVGLLNPSGFQLCAIEVGGSDTELVGNQDVTGQLIATLRAAKTSPQDKAAAYRSFTSAGSADELASELAQVNLPFDAKTSLNKLYQSSHRTLIEANAISYTCSPGQANSASTWHLRWH